jgi:DNA repair protein RadC
MSQVALPAWCRIVREVSPDLASSFAARPAIRGTDDAAAYLTPRLASEEVEVFVALLLDAQHRVIAAQEITRGLVNSSLVHPREVFRLAIAMNASAVIVAHNHPSGVLTPSIEDRQVTRQLIEAGVLLGIPVHDHLIIGLTGHLSFLQEGYL